MTVASDTAYRTLRDRIIAGSLAPGDRLVERTLCAELGISRTPVREALRQLTAEGLVTNRPHHGMAVAILSQREIEELFEFGVVTESFVAGLAAGKATADNIAELRKYLCQMDSSLQKAPDNPKDYGLLDHGLHAAIARMAGNQRLTGLLQQTMTPVVLSQVFAGYQPTDFKRSFAEHVVLVDAIESGDREWAQATMRAHILSGRGAAKRAQCADELSLVDNPTLQYTKP